LTDFGILEAKSQNNYEQLSKSNISSEQIADILELVAVVNNTKQINIQNLDKTIFAFYNITNLTEVANKYHTDKWEYIRGVERKILMMR